MVQACWRYYADCKSLITTTIGLQCFHLFQQPDKNDHRENPQNCKIYSRLVNVIKTKPRRGQIKMQYSINNLSHVLVCKTLLEDVITGVCVSHFH